MVRLLYALLIWAFSSQALRFVLLAIGVTLLMLVLFGFGEWLSAHVDDNALYIAAALITGLVAAITFARGR